MLQTLSFLAGGRQINAKATFFRYESARNGAADESIRVRADGNDLGTFLPGDAVELAAPCSLWEVIPATATTTGVVRVGMGRVSSARLTGSVAVVDGERAKVGAGVCFRQQVSQVGGGAQPAGVQVFNPAGSGINVFVNAVRAGASAADRWTLSRTTTQLVNLFSVGKNLVPTMASSIAVTRNDTATGIGSLADLAGFGQGYMAASSDIVIVFPKPILLPPGYGLALQLVATVAELRSTWEWEEWPI